MECSTDVEVAARWGFGDGAWGGSGKWWLGSSRARKVRGQKRSGQSEVEFWPQPSRSRNRSDSVRWVFSAESDTARDRSAGSSRSTNWDASESKRTPEVRLFHYLLPLAMLTRLDVPPGVTYASPLALEVVFGVTVLFPRLVWLGSRKESIRAG